MQIPVVRKSNIPNYSREIDMSLVEKKTGLFWTDYIRVCIYVSLELVSNQIHQNLRMWSKQQKYVRALKQVDRFPR